MSLIISNTPYLANSAAPCALPQLPYALDALTPYISAQTMDFHYNKHHKTYVDNLNKLLSDKQLSYNSLEETIVESAKKPELVGIFNNAAQVWNHNFFWTSLQPNGGIKELNERNMTIAQQIDQDFGGYTQFSAEFVSKAIAPFGSGWVWLVWCPQTLKLEVVSTSNAALPMLHDKIAIITCDVWEHAYYLDYQNLRKKFVETFLEHLVSWDFAQKNINKAKTGS